MISKPKFKICRRLGPGVYDKCQTLSLPASATKTLPGGKRPKAPTEYGAQAYRKQKVRFSYGIPNDSFPTMLPKASNIKGEVQRRNFLKS